MAADEATSRLLVRIFDEELGEYCAAHWGDDESLVEGDFGLVYSTELYCRWEKERVSERDAQRPLLLTNRGLYLPFHEKTGWFSSKLVLRMLPLADIRNCRKWIIPPHQRCLMVFGRNAHHILSIKSYSTLSRPDLANLSKALGYSYSKEEGF